MIRLCACLRAQPGFISPNDQSAVTWPPPAVQREERRQFWAAITTGQTSEDAASVAGVSPAVGTRWFREAGGMPPAGFGSSSKPPSGRYLLFAEREEIALLRAQGHGVREIARRLERTASTISRELRRNAATRGGGLDYRATSGTPTARRAAQSQPSWRSTRRCGSPCRIVWPARSSPRTGRRFTGRP